MGKNLFDVFCATTAIVSLCPLMALIAVLIRVTGKGPVLVRLARQGYQGQPFWLLRFRTASVDSEDWLNRHHSRGGAAHKPRLTRLERWLRRTSLEGLPQFFNVLLGDISLVGPRPLAMNDDARLKELDPEAYQRRLSAVPGLTGPWQVGGSTDADLRCMLRLDLEYLESWSFRRDLAILSRTAVNTLRGRVPY